MSNEPITADRDKNRLWSCRSKAAVVVAIRAGVLGPQEACDRYGLSLEVLAAWGAAFDQNGILGLRVTRLQMYRRAPLGKGS